MARIGGLTLDQLLQIAQVAWGGVGGESIFTYPPARLGLTFSQGFPLNF